MPAHLDTTSQCTSVPRSQCVRQFCPQICGIVDFTTLRLIGEQQHNSALHFMTALSNAALIRRTRGSTATKRRLPPHASRPAQGARYLLEQHSMCQSCLNLLTWSEDLRRNPTKASKSSHTDGTSVADVARLQSTHLAARGLQMHSMRLGRDAQ